MSGLHYECFCLCFKHIICIIFSMKKYKLLTSSRLIPTRDPSHAKLSASWSPMFSCLIPLPVSTCRSINLIMPIPSLFMPNHQTHYANPHSSHAKSSYSSCQSSVFLCQIISLFSTTLSLLMLALSLFMQNRQPTLSLLMSKHKRTHSVFTCHIVGFLRPTLSLLMPNHQTHHANPHSSQAKSWDSSCQSSVFLCQIISLFFSYKIVSQPLFFSWQSINGLIQSSHALPSVFSRLPSVFSC